MPLGTEVDLGPGHTVLDKNPAPPERGTAAPLHQQNLLLKNNNLLYSSQCEKCSDTLVQKEFLFQL